MQVKCEPKLSQKNIYSQFGDFWRSFPGSNTRYKLMPRVIDSHIGSHVGMKLDMEACKCSTINRLRLFSIYT